MQFYFQKTSKDAENNALKIVLVFVPVVVVVVLFSRSRRDH